MKQRVRDLVKRMGREEWRLQSSLYNGKNLATLPLLLFVLTTGFLFTAVELAGTTVHELGLLVAAFGFFTGLAGGSIGFSGKDALENVLGKVNFLIYSSRTLPVERRDLVESFIIKDILYYSFLYILPVTAASVLVLGTPALPFVALTFTLFLTGIFTSLVTVNTVTVSRKDFMKYSSFNRLDPVARKSVVDVSRSTGGFLKILFSVGILLGFYWYLVFNVPLTSYLLNSPLLSFGAITGLIGITVYNWLNTYDNENDYSHLPLERRKILDGKFQAYQLINFVLITVMVVVSYLFYPGNLLLALFLGYCTAYYAGTLMVYMTGLEPNEKMLDSEIFLKIMVILNIGLVPLLLLTAFTGSTLAMTANSVLMLAGGKLMLWKKGLN